uniref:Putative ovule protein n=1 Tax=Solanum chacoense TaxID=4108 RepID=A0A0V0GM65_SOLCH
MDVSWSKDISPMLLHPKILLFQCYVQWIQPAIRLMSFNSIKNLMHILFQISIGVTLSSIVYLISVLLCEQSFSSCVAIPSTKSL